MLTLRRCCLPGGVDRSEGVRNTTIYYTRIEKAKEDEKERLGLANGGSTWEGDYQRFYYVEMFFRRDGVATAGLGGRMGCLAMLQVKQLDDKVTSQVINRENMHDEL